MQLTRIIFADVVMAAGWTDRNPIIMSIQRNLRGARDWDGRTSSQSISHDIDASTSTAGASTSEAGVQGVSVSGPSTSTGGATNTDDASDMEYVSETDSAED